MTTRNIELMATEVAQHIAADAVIQGIYWNHAEQKGCFIGCLGHSDDPGVAVERFGLTEPLLRIAESIFEALPAAEARDFFAAFPKAIGCDGRDLSLVHWQFLATELRALPSVPDDVQAVIDPVIVGMDLLVSGQEWPEAAKAAEAAADVARTAAGATESVLAAVDAAWAAAETAARAATKAAAWAVARAARAAWAAQLDVQRRQRDLLLDLIRQAPVVEVQS